MDEIDHSISTKTENPSLKAPHRPPPPPFWAVSFRSPKAARLPAFPLIQWPGFRREGCLAGAGPHPQIPLQESESTVLKVPPVVV